MFLSVSLRFACVQYGEARERRVKGAPSSVLPRSLSPVSRPSDDFPPAARLLPLLCLRCAISNAPFPPSLRPWPFMQSLSSQHEKEVMAEKEIERQAKEKAAKEAAAKKKK